MSEEIRESVQVIEVIYDGVEIAMKVGSGGYVIDKTESIFYSFKRDTSVALERKNGTNSG